MYNYSVRNKKSDVVMSILALCIVSGLLFQGMCSMWSTDESGRSSHKQAIYNKS